jgi:hypothetical protein
MIGFKGYPRGDARQDEEAGQRALKVVKEKAGESGKSTGLASDNIR